MFTAKSQRFLLYPVNVISNIHKVYYTIQDKGRIATDFELSINK